MTPEQLQDLRISYDRELVRRGGLRAFVRQAWPHVEARPLQWSWHMDAMCEHLEAVSAGEILELVICIPPGASKSLLVSTLWPAYDWAVVNPSRKFLGATYGQELSDKNARLHRDLILTPWYTQRWNVRIGKDDVAKVREFRNSHKGWRISTSVGGRATGIHADVHIGDDLAKAQDATGKAYVDPQAIEKANEFWFGAMATRRADAVTLARVMVAQRLHHEDTPGKCIDRGWKALVLPMEYDPKRSCVTVWRRRDGSESTWRDPRTEEGELLIPDRFPRHIVDADKASNPHQHEAQNQQNPTPREGAILKPQDRYMYDDLPAKLGKRIITVDCAFKGKETSDFVSIQVWAKDQDGVNFYLIDRDTRRLSFTQTLVAIMAMSQKYPRCGIHIEDKANGPAVIDVLKGSVFGVVPWDPGTDNKISRAEAVSHLFESGNVWLPRNAPWLPEYLGVLRKFPLVKHDDDVDATTMALRILYSPRAKTYADAVAKMVAGLTPYR